jgi:hypothetical protein
VPSSKLDFRIYWPENFKIRIFILIVLNKIGKSHWSELIILIISCIQKQKSLICDNHIWFRSEYHPKICVYVSNMHTQSSALAVVRFRSVTFANFVEYLTDCLSEYLVDNNYNPKNSSQYRVPRCSLEIFSKFFFPSTIRLWYINVNNGVFCLIISYLRIKSYNVLNYNNYSTDWSFPLKFA